VQEFAVLTPQEVAGTAPRGNPGRKLFGVSGAPAHAETKKTAREFNEIQPGFEGTIAMKFHG
jgi:hypothetical protein